MILTIHILLAVFSIIYSAITAFVPSTNKLRLTYITSSLTLSSGILLVLVEPATMVQACISGLVYFGCILVIIAFTRKKLAHEYIKKDQ